MARAKKSATPEITETQVIAYKGFDKDLKCRGYQYEVGRTYEHEGRVEACASGFHACENPMDVWGYYGPVDEGGRLSRYAAVSMAGAISREGQNDSKLASGRITIEAEITLPQFVKKAVDWLIDATKGKDESGDYARIGSSGNSARIVADGKNSVVAAAGAGTTVSGAVGLWISIAEFRDGKCVGFATGCIGQDGLEAGVPYIARGGKLVPAS